MRGLELSQRFWQEAVEAIARRVLPDTPFAAGLLGRGSEVLGFDDDTSTDHGWGPRLQLFLPDAVRDTQCAALHDALSHHLPRHFLGYPTSFVIGDDGSPMLDASGDGPVRHRVEITTVRRFFIDYVRWDPIAPPDARIWLSMSPQALRSVSPAAGAVFSDEVGDLTRAREMLAWYPDDVWRYLLAVEWERLAEEEPFMARTAQVGDEIGSRLIAARLTQTLMQIAFMLDQQYAPYSKWFGTAFQRLPLAAGLIPDIATTLSSDDWRVREAALLRIGSALISAQNALGIAAPLDPTPRQFHLRDIRVLDAGRLRDALLAAISDPWIRSLPPRLGSLRQLTRSDDVMEANRVWTRLARVYDDEPST